MYNGFLMKLVARHAVRRMWSLGSPSSPRSAQTKAVAVLTINGRICDIPTHFIPITCIDVLSGEHILATRRLAWQCPPFKVGLYTALVRTEPGCSPSSRRDSH